MYACANTLRTHTHIDTHTYTHIHTHSVRARTNAHTTHTHGARARTCGVCAHTHARLPILVRARVRVRVCANVCANVCVCARPWVPRLVHVAARRDGRVQPRELRQRAQPAADRAGEAVRAKRAAHPPRAWAAKRRCAAGRAAWPPSGGRAHRATRSVSLPSSGGSVPLSLLPPTVLPHRLPPCRRARRHYAHRMHPPSLPEVMRGNAVRAKLCTPAHRTHSRVPNTHKQNTHTRARTRTL
jgi:hypothetical protein